MRTMNPIILVIIGLICYTGSFAKPTQLPSAIVAFQQSKLDGGQVKQRVKGFEPNVTKGCTLSPDHQDDWPTLYRRTAPEEFRRHDFLAALTAVQTMDYVDTDLMWDNVTYAKIVAGQSEKDYSVYVSDADRLVLVGFSASNGIATDLNVKLAKCKIDFAGSETFDCGTVHEGFYTKYKKNYETVIPIYQHYLEQGYTAIITGGSQGGAVASLAALHAKHIFPDKTIELYTMSAPEFQNKMPQQPYQAPDIYRRYVTSYVNNYDHKHHYGYFCVDDVVVLPTALTSPFVKFFHLVDAIHIPCNEVVGGVEQPQPPDNFTFATLRLINWHCHVPSMYDSRFAFWYLGTKK